MEWFTYEIGPIDHGWELSETVSQFLRRIGESELLRNIERLHHSKPNGDDFGDEVIDASSFVALYQSAWSECGAAAYDELRQEPQVFAVPSEGMLELGFIFKEDNNGTTYVVSPVPLPHLV